MRATLLVLIAAACRSPAPPPVAAPAPTTPAVTAAPPPSPAPVAAPQPEVLAADTARTTVRGNPFVAPAGWSIVEQGAALILSPPETGSHIALVDVEADDAQHAISAAWAVYKRDATWPVKNTTHAADHDGWDRIEANDYQTSPNEHRDVGAVAQHAGGGWTVVIYDMAEDVGEKRGAQVAVIFSKLLPKGYTRESFAGQQAHELDAARLAELDRFVRSASEQLHVPGIAYGLVQHGKVIYAGGVGLRELGGKQKVDADTLFMVASNTKALTTLMLAKLVDEGKLTWETAVTTLLPSFALGDPDTTRQVLVKHLICACTGLPRQDYEWLLEFGKATPETAMAMLTKMKPTSKFGEMFQYSNLMAAAAGYVGGHVAYPKLELGAAYDKAMQTRVFGPLGMKASTFDYKRALAGNHASAHAPDADGKLAKAVMGVNYAAIPVRPAGALWSNVRDMLRYVQMELDEGTVGGKRYIAKEPLLARRAPQVAMSKDATYGMGLMVDREYEIAVVHHGGDLIGYHSDMIWLPEYGVGAVILTNGDPGFIARDVFRRKLLEVLFDGKPEADARLAAAGKAYYDQLAAERRLTTIPAAAADVALLAPHYTSEALGDITVKKAGAATVFDFGEWQSEVGSRHNPDGTVSFLLTSPGVDGAAEMVVGPDHTLVVRDAQHEYVFHAK
ncbi:MAG: serine hydrolase domain-containing protein [Acidobacteriota bacterium]